MPEFTVLRRVDAFVDYTAIVEADDEAAAAEQARKNEEDYEWKLKEVVQFDARCYVTLDLDGDELEATSVGDF